MNKLVSKKTKFPVHKAREHHSICIEWGQGDYVIPIRDLQNFQQQQQSPTRVLCIKFNTGDTCQKELGLINPRTHLFPTNFLK